MRTITIRALTLATAFALLVPTQAGAAVGCTLNDPDRDIMRIFPGATSYVTEFIAVSERGGDSLAASIEVELGDTLDPTFEALDVPYAYYTVLKGSDVIGRVHGVNQKGMFGGMQLILATDTDGTIVDFYYQKLSSPEAKAFRADGFTDEFIGLSLEDFLAKTGETGESAAATVASIEDPSSESADDLAATLRGLRKNLLLLRELILTPDAVETTEEDE